MTLATAFIDSQTIFKAVYSLMVNKHFQSFKTFTVKFAKHISYKKKKQKLQFIAQKKNLKIFFSKFIFKNCYFPRVSQIPLKLRNQLPYIK